VVTCPSCSEENPEGFRFCGFCSAALDRGDETTGEERKVVTILFCDLVGFTASSDASDPEDVRATLRPYHALLREAIEYYGGTVEKFVGDAVMAAFGAPTAHEDDPERSIRSALRILQAIEELNAAEGLVLAVRIGINTGEAVVTLGAKPAEGEGFVSGDVVNVASRLQGIAPIGGIVVGEGTYRATRYMFDYEELEPVTLKGKAEPVPVWRPLSLIGRWGMEVDPEPSTPFVGRELERKLLEGLYARAIKESSVQLVTISGEPGIGKSRLIHELSQFVEEQEEIVSWRQGRCLAYGEGIAFWALGEIVKAHAGILESDDAETAARRLDSAVEAVIEDESDRAWVRARLAPLVGLVGGDQQVSVERMESFTAWTSFLEGLAASRPLVLVVEDLHWADEAMVAFLEHLVEWASGVAILLVCAARPELFERHPGWGAVTRNATRIALDPLSDQDTALLVSALLERSELPADTQAQLLERASGNPLYAEEFVRVLRDRGLIDDAGRVAEDVGWGVEVFPETVQSLIAARLDTLPQERKALLQDAAVIGKVFWSGAVAAMGARDDAFIEQELHELARKELIRPSRTSAVAGQAEYAFWHALVRDVAYGQIPRAARAGKHRAAAEWIESTAGERAADVAELLINHFSQAVELWRAAGADNDAAALTDPLRRALVMAAERAEGLDLERAEEAWRGALELTPFDHADRPLLLLSWGSALHSMGRYTAAIDPLDEAATEFRARGDAASEAVAIARRARIAFTLGRLGARNLIAPAIDIVDRIVPCPETIDVLTMAAGISFQDGDSAAAITLGRRAIAVAGELGVVEPIGTRGLIGAARCDLGDEDGLEDLRGALTLALREGRPSETLTLYNNLAYSLQMLHGPPAAVEILRECIDFGKQRGLDPFFGVGFLVKALGEIGELDEALALGQSLSVGASEAEATSDLVEIRSAIARILAWRNQHRDAVPHIEWALEFSRRSANPQDAADAFTAAVSVRSGFHETEAVRALIQELMGVRNVGHESEFAIRLPEMIRVAFGADAPELTEPLVELCGKHAPVHRHALCTAEALLAEHRRDFEAAAASFEEAATRWSGFGVVLEEAHALLGLGRCLMALRRRGARDQLFAARAIFERLDVISAVAETDVRLAQVVASTS
jgi:class 3 adenylate cyclase/tetratricopeptide (TPR) repeat protein